MKLTALAAFAASLFLVAPAGAVVVVSGDTQIGNGIDGSGFDPLTSNPGNRRLFLNILGPGTTVLVLEPETTISISAPQASDAVTVFYDALPGVGATSLVNTTVLTAPLLMDVDLLVALLPDPFSPAEIAAIVGFVDGGGSVLFSGDNTVFADNNANVNAVLAALGSSLSLANVNSASGESLASGDRILSSPLTAGVASITYASSAWVQGGTPLVLAANDNPILAFEGALPAVPLPAPVLPLLLALAALGLAGRRRA